MFQHILHNDSLVVMDCIDELCSLEQSQTSEWVMVQILLNIPGSRETPII